jgi:uncharacterized phage protein gp47/JayE
MAFEPETQQSIYESIRDRLKGRITGLTNFTDTSFNWVWTQAFSAELREQEIEKTATYLSGLIDYSGGPLEQEDLQELGIDDRVDLDEINELMDDEDLDRLVEIVGVERDLGTAATGIVTFQTQSGDTPIPAGTIVGTQPDNSGSFLEFTTNNDVNAGPGVTSVDAEITASEVGTNYNVGSGTITYLPDPPSGVQGVSNTNATSGGEDVESNDELRERAKRSIFANSGGGTVEGIRGYINTNVENVDEVQIVEFPNGDLWHGDNAHAHVIVSGGSEDDILTAIDESRPVAVEHVFIRPDSFSVRVDISIEGTDITSQVRDRISENIKSYIDSLGLNDEVVDSKLIQTIMNADSDINDIPSLELYIEDEPTFFDSSVDVYELSQGGIMADDGITNVRGQLGGSSNYEFVEDTDYQEWNTTAGSTATPHDAIDWSLNGDDPDITTGETETIRYNSNDEEYFVDEAMITNGITEITGTLNGSSHTFTKGTDFEESDIRVDGVINAVDWSIGGDSPDVDTDFTVTYDAGTQFFTTYKLEQNKDIKFDEQQQPISGTVNITVV